MNATQRAIPGGFELLELPSGRVLRVCATCAVEPPRHQCFCPAVIGYKRSDVLREMVELDDEIARLEIAIAAAGGDQQVQADQLAAYGVNGRSGSGVRTPLLRLCGDRFLARNAFWDWAWWIGLDFWMSTAEARADVRAEVAQFRAHTLQRLEASAA